MGGYFDGIVDSKEERRHNLVKLDLVPNNCQAEIGPILFLLLLLLIRVVV